MSQGFRAWSPLILAFCAGILHWADYPIQFAADPHEDRCLPEVKYAILVRSKPTEFQHGDLVIWRGFGALSYVPANSFAMKKVVGVPGDKLLIKEAKVFINGELVLEGLPLAQRVYGHPPSWFEKDETIPEGQIFVAGTNPKSEDSRYWGYLPTDKVEGKGYPILQFLI